MTVTLSLCGPAGASGVLAVEMAHGGDAQVPLEQVSAPTRYPAFAYLALAKSGLSPSAIVGCVRIASRNAV
jgi:hypothetical protein